jgi:uncharacterized protein
MSEKIQLKPRALSTVLEEVPKGPPRLLLVTGARQTGKTTLVRELFKDRPYFNCDSLEVRDELKAVPAREWGRVVGNAVVDEVQKEPSVFEKVKYAFDEGKVRFTVLLGSSQILLMKKVRESLAGRVFVHELWPLMNGELAAKGGDFGTPLFSKCIRSNGPIGKVLAQEPSVLVGEAKRRPQTAEEYLLRWGGMPGLLPLSDSDREKWLRSYEYTYLEKDLGDLARLDDLEPFKKVQRLCAARSAGILSYSELARDAGVSVDTARRYLEYLRLSYQAFLLPSYHENLTSAVVKAPKVYWSDVGLLRQLTGRWGAEEGGVVETYAVSEMHKWVRTAGERAELFYYRTRSGFEVDLLVKVEKGFLGIEIKSRAKAEPKDFTGLTALADRLGKKWLGGVCLHRGSSIEERDTKRQLWAVPIHRWVS